MKCSWQRWLGKLYLATAAKLPGTHVGHIQLESDWGVIKPENLIGDADQIDEKKDTINANQDQTKPKEAIIYATVVLDSCQQNQVTWKNFDSVSQIIDSKEHLRQNIEHFEFGNMSSSDIDNRQFKHQIQAVLKVKTYQLWESPRSYLWRHLGKNSTWTLEDGTEVSIIRIHQRQIVFRLPSSLPWFSRRSSVPYKVQNKMELSNTVHKPTLQCLNEINNNIKNIKNIKYIKYYRGNNFICFQAIFFNQNQDTGL